MLETFACFNPRTLMGATEPVEGMTPEDQVSIHAPPKGATYHLFPILRTYIVSIHAPPNQRVRRQKDYDANIKQMFQSTHPKGCDDFFTSNPTNQIVSIHAPTEGTTMQPCTNSQNHEVSTPAPHERHDLGNRKIGIDFFVSIYALMLWD